VKKGKKIRVRKHRRKKKKGGSTVVREHSRKIKFSKKGSKRLRKKKLEAMISPQFKAYITGETRGWIDIPLRIIATEESIPEDELSNYYQEINRERNKVTYKGRDIVKIPKRNDFLLEAKLKLWSELNRDWPSIAHKPRYGPWEILDHSDLDYEELLNKAIEYQKEFMDKDRELLGRVDRKDIDNLQEIIWFVSRLLNTRRISKEIADRATFLLEKEREREVQDWLKGWLEWGKIRST
jgi:hypothetical protein